MDLPEADSALHSPCVKICVLDAARVCVGCMRTSDEIANWESMGDAARSRVLERVRRAMAARSGEAPG